LSTNNHAQHAAPLSRSYPKEGRDSDPHNVKPYCNLPQTDVLDSEAFGLFECPGDVGPNEQYNPSTQNGSVGLAGAYTMTCFQNKGSRYTVPLVPVHHSNDATVPIPDGTSWAFGTTHRNLMGRRTHESGDPAKQVVASDNHSYMTPRDHTGWDDWAWYGQNHAAELAFNNMGFLDGHVKFLLPIRDPSTTCGGRAYEYSYTFIPH